MTIVRSFFISLLWLITFPGHAKTTAADIHAVVVDYAETKIQQKRQSYGEETRIDYKVSQLDPRLNLADCNIPIETEAKQQSGAGFRFSVKVSCTGQTPWSIYVPVDVEVYRQVVTTTSPLARGTALESHHLQLQEVPTGQLHGSYFTDKSALIGMELRRSLNANTTVLRNQISPPLMIKKGDAVMVMASAPGLTVKIPGIAMRDGRQGQQILVKNRQSKRTIEARVTAPGQVQVVM